MLTQPDTVLTEALQQPQGSATARSLRHPGPRTIAVSFVAMEEPADASKGILQLLGQLRDGTSVPANELMPLVYDDLRRLAASRMARLAPGQTIQATALVHEAWLRMVGDQDPGWRGRAHFFAAAARSMRNIVCDHLQRKRRLKHGGEMRRVDAEPDEVAASGVGPGANDLVVAEALAGLEQDHPRKAEIVTLSFFGGLSTEEIAEVMGLSTRTVERDWRFARAWLNSRLAEREDEA